MKRSQLRVSDNILIGYTTHVRHGFLLIHKPRGPTSHDIVAQVRRILSERKIGHLGTLDPLASGLMILAVGAKALKVVELFNALPKVYEAVITLGVESSTYDAEGVLETLKPKAGWLPPEDSSKIQAIIDDRFLGKIQQVPPAFSAIHVGGERAYWKAMRGENVEMKARETTISVCKVIDYHFPIVRLSVHCDSGTYIRSLAHDLGFSLRCGGYLSALVRTSVGEWNLQNALAPESIGWVHVLPLREILKDLLRRELTGLEWEEIRNGRPIAGDMDPENPCIAWFEDLPVALLERSRKREGMLKPRKVL